jgi:hypothetical protein
MKSKQGMRIWATPWEAPRGGMVRSVGVAPSAPDQRQEPAGAGILLAVAAALAAAIGGWSSIVGDRGSDTWHAAVRQHVKQAAGAVEDIRFAYQEEGPTALLVAEAEILADEYRRSGERASGVARELLLLEAAAQEEAVDVMAAGSEVAGDPRYDDPDTDGYDLVLRLADNRAEHPDLLAVDPDATEAEGSRYSVEAALLLLWIVPVSAAFLCGALTYGFARGRRALVAAGFVFAAVGAIGAVVTGVTV